MGKIIFELPFPPSLNGYYRHVGKMVLISAKGRKYREAVEQIAVMDNIQNIVGKAEIVTSLQVYPPDKRKRDIDNILKCLFDSLTKAKVWEDDSQIKKLEVEMLEPLPPAGMVVVTIQKYQKMETNISRARRSYLTRYVVFSMQQSLERKVAILFMLRYSDFQIREELKITNKQLLESKEKIKNLLIQTFNQG